MDEPEDLDLGQRSSLYEVGYFTADPLMEPTRAPLIGFNFTPGQKVFVAAIVAVLLLAVYFFLPSLPPVENL